MIDATHFDHAIEIALEHEGFGKVSNHPADPGGITKWGISLRLLYSLGDRGDIDGDGDVDGNDIRDMTRAQAENIYREVFWEPYRYSLFHAESAATKVFDLTVNMGPKSSHRCLQRALRACGQDVEEDGILGPVTRAAVNTVASYQLIPALRSEAAGFYRLLVQREPFRRPFLKGWLNRAYW